MTQRRVEGGRASVVLGWALVALGLLPVSVRLPVAEITGADLAMPGLVVWATSRWRLARAFQPELRAAMQHAVVVLFVAVCAWLAVPIVVARIDAQASFFAMLFFLRSFILVLPILVLASLSPKFGQRIANWMIASITSLVSIPLLLSGNRIRVEYFSDQINGFVVALNGDFLGLPLFGLGQINTYALWLAVGACCASVISFDQKERVWARALSGVGAISSAYIVFQSGSRTGVLVFACFAVLLTRSLARTRVGFAIVCLVFVVSSAVVVSPRTFGIPALVSDRTLERLSVSDESTLDELSNGRLFILTTLVADTIRSPIVGTGFNDFELFHASDPDLHGSPHNQWFGAFHKMGIVGGIAYASFFKRLVFVRRAKLRRLTPRNLALAGLSSTFVLDALTVPITAMMLALLIGLAWVASLDEAERSVSKGRGPGRAESPVPAT